MNIPLRSDNVDDSAGVGTDRLEDPRAAAFLPSELDVPARVCPLAKLDSNVLVSEAVLAKDAKEASCASERIKGIVDVPLDVGRASNRVRICNRFELESRRS